MSIFKTKKPGGEVEHKEITLKMIKYPDLIVKHHSQTYQGCEFRLEDVEPKKTMKCQVFNLSTLKIQVTEHQALIKVYSNSNYHYKNKGQFPKHVMQPT